MKRSKQKLYNVSERFAKCRRRWCDWIRLTTVVLLYICGRILCSKVEFRTFCLNVSGTKVAVLISVLLMTVIRSPNIQFSSTRVISRW